MFPEIQKHLFCLAAGAEAQEWKAKENPQLL